MGAFSFDSIHGFINSVNFIRRQNKMAEILLNEDADVLCLQEVHTYSFLSILKKKLIKHTYLAYKPFVYGPRGGMVIFSKIPFEKIEYINFKKRGSIINTSFIARVIRNGILSCKLKGLSVVILNTHTTPNLDHDYLEKNRFIQYTDAQLAQLSNVIIKESKNNSNIVLGGDLNVSQDSSTFKEFLRVSDAKDVFSKYNTPTQHQEFLPSKKKVMRIDYILLHSKDNLMFLKRTKQLFIQKHLLTNGKMRYLSDHIGLRADFVLQR